MTFCELGICTDPNIHGHLTALMTNKQEEAIGTCGPKEASGRTGVWVTTVEKWDLAGGMAPKVWGLFDEKASA